MKTKLLALAVLVSAYALTFAAEKFVDIRVTTKGDTLAFDVTEITVTPGKKVQLTFKNLASLGSGLQHNWVLVKSGKAEAVASAGLSAGMEKGWLQESPDVLAHTQLLMPGQDQTISFVAPKTKGDYPYICTFPGHSTTMKGVLHVK